MQDYFSYSGLGTNLWCLRMCSRSDAFFGNVFTFNQTIFDETKSFWTDEILSIQMAANARVARIKTSQATNPTYELSELGKNFSFGESVAYMILLGDKNSGTANRSWVEFFFGEGVPCSTHTQFLLSGLFGVSGISPAPRPALLPE